MLDFASTPSSTFFDLSPIRDLSAIDRLDTIRELHERLTSTIRDQQQSIEAARTQVYR